MKSMQKPKIGISLRIVDAPNYDEKRDALSHDWPTLLEKLGFHPIYIPNTLKHVDEFFSDMSLDGLILSGGDNVGENKNRDETENLLLKLSIDKKIPVFGVCRGMQMINVASGGTLYGDIPSEIGTEVIHRNNGEVMHEIAVTESYPLIFPEGQDTFMVNSWHHQGLKNIPDGINVVARSFDGLPEAIYIDEKLHPFMIAVQFHPERLGAENGIHKNMRKNFFDAIYKD